MQARTFKPEAYLVTAEPYYEPIGKEIALFEAAYANQLPVLLKGPTGCGKTRFIEHMAWRLKRPLITVSCHDDLTAADLVGRYLVVGGETVWVEVVETTNAESACQLATHAADAFARLDQDGLKAWILLAPASAVRCTGSSASRIATTKRCAPASPALPPTTTPVWAWRSATCRPY